MTQPTEESRKAFEAWAEQSTGYRQAASVMPNEWLAWQASEERMREEMKKILLNMRCDTYCPKTLSAGGEECDCQKTEALARIGRAGM